MKHKKSRDRKDSDKSARHHSGGGDGKRETREPSSSSKRKKSRHKEFAQDEDTRADTVVQ